MRVRKYMLPLFMVSLIVAALSCAKVGAPSGGPKDKTPPVIVKSEPENGTISFTGDRFTLQFNEFVTLDKITDKLMVSPPLKKRPDVSIKGKSIIVRFDEQLRDSTTYTFYFGDAIRDLNEGNILDNYQYVFSTGPVIDSLSVSGTVFDSYTLDPAENTLIMLYPDLTDTAFIKQLPAYISKTNAEGKFTISNISDGEYNIFALRDADNSKNYNIADEEIAFLDSTIFIDPLTNYFAPADTTDSLNVSSSESVQYYMYLFKPMKRLRYLNSTARDTRYLLTYTLSLPPDSLPFEVRIDGSQPGSWFAESSPEKDTLLIWLKDSSLYSQPQISSIVTYPYTDSTGMVISRSDTVEMRFLAPRATPGRKTVPVPYRVSSGIFAGSLRPGQKIWFKSETPFRPPDTSRIRIWEVSDKIRKKVPYSIVPVPGNSRLLELRTEFSQGKNYIFSADSASFGSIYGEVADSTGARITVRNNETFGSLILNIDNFEGSVILQLLSNQEKTVVERKADKPGRIDFGLLDKGVYRLRAIYDLNGDGKWTRGDYFTGRQPEPVTFYDTELEVKENWNVENNWDLSMQRKKILKPATQQGARR